MKTSSPRILAAAVAGLLLLAACGGTSGSTWTINPISPTPTPGPSTVASAQPSSATTTAPSGDASVAPGSPAASSDASPTAGQTITLQLTGSLQITQDGQTVSALTVKEGETVHFVIDNVAGFGHNFFIGAADALAQNQVGGLPGIPEWTSGIQEFDYVVTAETAGLQFACTIPGHYPPMHGTFTVVP
jgi:uncharacterized cupredoxin-like copper-binding protein